MLTAMDDQASRTSFSRQVRVDRIVDLALNRFDKYSGDESVDAELDRIRGWMERDPESFGQAIARLEDLAAQYPHDSIARAACDWLREIKATLR